MYIQKTPLKVPSDRRNPFFLAQATVHCFNYHMLNQWIKVNFDMEVHSGYHAASVSWSKKAVPQDGLENMLLTVKC